MGHTLPPIPHRPRQGEVLHSPERRRALRPHLFYQFAGGTSLRENRQGSGSKKANYYRAEEIRSESMAKQNERYRKTGGGACTENDDIERERMVSEIMK